MNEIYLDKLTGLNNIPYLEKNYHLFITAHPNSKYIMIDLTKFKKINDTYGHEAGDACLKTFAQKLQIYFKESMLVRLHGDEFVIISYSNDERIKSLFDLIHMSLEADVRSGSIPVNFDFNAGYAPVSDDLSATAEKADCMMYYGKEHKQCFVPYSDEIYNAKLEEEAMNADFNDKLKREKFSYYGRRIYNTKNKITPFVQVYTKDINGAPLLTRKLYGVIRNNQEISRFDLYNLQKLVELISMTYCKDKYFINIDYRSLFSIRELRKFLEVMKETSINGLNNIVLSIDVTGIESTEYDLTIDIINMIREYGFEISLNKVNSKIPPYFLATSNPDYIKVVADAWKKAYGNPKSTDLLRKAVEFLSICGHDSRVIFDRVETKDQSDFIEEFAPPKSLKSGDYFSKEKRLQFK